MMSINLANQITTKKSKKQTIYFSGFQKLVMGLISRVNFKKMSSGDCFLGVTRKMSALHVAFS